MFRNKERIRILEAKIATMQEENEALERCVESWKKSSNENEEKLQIEQFKNHKNLETLKAINKEIKASNGSYPALMNLVKKIKKELANADNID